MPNKVVELLRSLLSLVVILLTLVLLVMSFVVANGFTHDLPEAEPRFWFR